MIFQKLFSPCLFLGHLEPLKVMRGKVFVFACSRCLQITGQPLPKQRFTARREPRPKQGRSAEVLRPAKFGR